MCKMIHRQSTESAAKANGSRAATWFEGMRSQAVEGACGHEHSNGLTQERTGASKENPLRPAAGETNCPGVMPPGHNQRELSSLHRPL